MSSIKKHLIFLFSSISLLSCKSINKKDIQQNKNSDYSNYYRLVSIADSSYAAGNYNKSVITLDTLFKRVKPLSTPEYSEYDTDT